jgi:hypothetical protein
MKKLNKLQINPDRLMKNEELTSLKGGNTYRSACLGYGNIFDVTADSLTEALIALSYVCPAGGSCFE